MASKKKPSTEKLKMLVDKYAGCTMDIAKACKVTRVTIWNWRQQDKEFDDEMNKGNDIMLDLAKEGLKHLLEKKSEKAILYTLDRLGRKDGFGMMIQVQDKSKLENQLDSMSDADILEMMEKNSKRIKKGQ